MLSAHVDELGATMMERCVICRQRELRSRVFEGMCAKCTFDELQRVRKERNEFKARLDGMRLNATTSAERVHDVD